MIFQELNLFPNLSMTENIFIGQEITSQAVMIDQRAQERIARELLARLEHPLDPNTLVGSFR